MLLLLFFYLFFLNILFFSLKIFFKIIPLISPSMTANTQIDSELKIGALDDTFTIVDIEKM